MAYGTKYQLPFAGLTMTGDILIKKLDWVGGITQLRLIHDGLETINDWGGWDDPVIKQRAVFQFVNDASDFYEYIDLFELEEKQFQVLITITDGVTPITLFDGWLDSKTVQQKYLNNSTVSLTASNFVSKLKYSFDTEIETLQEVSLINYINHALLDTGKDDDVNVNCHLAPVGHTASIATASSFTLSGLYTETFWKNNIERINSLDIITSILTPLGCYLYWWDDRWWIERYRDIYAATISAYRYSISGDYSYGSGVTAWPRTNTISDLQNLTWTETAQTMSMIPGFRKLEILLNQKTYLNLVINDFSGASVYDSGGFAPSKREWEYFDGNSYVLPGASFMNINNSIKRLGYTSDSGESGKDFFEYQYGIGSVFQLTATSTANLSISWKSTYYCGSVGFNACTTPENITFIYNYWVRLTGTSNYLYYDSDEEEWIVYSSATEKEATNEININGGSSYIDSVYKCLPSVTIPISEITQTSSNPGPGGTYDPTTITGDQSFEFMIGVGMVKSGSTGQYGAPTAEYLGDVVITVDSDSQENLITGDLSNNVLQDKRIDLDIFDSENLNYVNGLLTDTSYDERTDTWVEDADSSSPDHTLAEWLMISKFQLYNKNRKKITGTINSTRFLRPFELFYDSLGGSSAEDPKYLLIPDSYWPLSDRYKVSLYEYNITDEINLV